MSKQLATGGRKKFLFFTGRNIWQNQAQGCAAVCCYQLRCEGKEK